MKTNPFGVLVLAVSLAIVPPVMAQQFQTGAEYDAYLALYNEQDPATKIQLGEEFLAAYPDSEAAPIAYQLLVATHYSERNWRGLIDVAKRFDREQPDAAADTKTFIYARAMAAAQQEQQPLDILDFGDKILELDRNNLGALLTLPPVILDNLPEFGRARETNLARAFELASRARVRAQSVYPISTTDPQQALQRNQVFSRIYLYLGQIHELRGDDPRAATEYARILEFDPRSSDAYLRLGLAHQRQAAADSVLLEQALANAPGINEETPPPEDPLTPPRDPESAALEDAVIRNLDLAIDYLASAAALGGQSADLARVELERLYPMRNDDSLDGLEELIQDKRIRLTQP